MPKKHAYSRNCGCGACTAEWMRRSTPVAPKPAIYSFCESDTVFQVYEANGALVGHCVPDRLDDYLLDCEKIGLRGPFLVRLFLCRQKFLAARVGGEYERI